MIIRSLFYFYYVFTIDIFTLHLFFFLTFHLLIVKNI